MYKTLNISNFEIKTKKSESLIEQKLLNKIENEFSDSVKEESFFKFKFQKFIKLFLKNSDSHEVLPTNSKLTFFFESNLNSNVYNFLILSSN